MNSSVDEVDEAAVRNAGRVYVRRRGRTTAAQTRALESLSTRYLLDLPSSVLDAAFWESVFGRRAPLAVEIGFGNGVALVALARSHPAWNCVGVDVYRPGFGALMLACERDGIDNVRIADQEALTFLRRLEPAAVHLVHVFFPDPWPKKRHRKRRLVNAAFAAASAACLEPRGTLSLATDWEEYATRMQEALDAEPSLRGGVAQRPANRPLTPFETKGLAGDRAVVDLRYQRHATSETGC